MKHDCLAKGSVWLVAYRMSNNLVCYFQLQINYYRLNQWTIKICYDY